MSDAQDQLQIRYSLRALRLYGIAQRTLSVASGVMVGMMMFLTVGDVIGRYILNSPILGAFELTEVLMGLVIFGGLPWVSAERKHISVDFLSRALSPRGRRVQAVFLEFICGLFAGFMAWRMWLYAARLIQYRETTLELQISKGLIAYAMSALLMLAAVVFLINAWSIAIGSRSADDGL